MIYTFQLDGVESIGIVSTFETRRFNNWIHMNACLSRTPLYLRSSSQPLLLRLGDWQVGRYVDLYT